MPSTSKKPIKKTSSPSRKTTRLSSVRKKNTKATTSPLAEGLTRGVTGSVRRSKNNSKQEQLATNKTDSLSDALTTQEYDPIEALTEDQTEEVTHSSSQRSIRRRVPTIPGKTVDYTRELIPTAEPGGDRRGLLWAGVLGFMAVILFFWVWNLKLHFSQAAAAMKADQALLAQTKETWHKAFADTTTTPPINTEKLKTALSELFATSTTSTIPQTTATSSTLDVKVSSIPSSTVSSSSTIISTSTPLLTPSSTTSTAKKKVETLPPSRPRRR